MILPPKIMFSRSVQSMTVATTWIITIVVILVFILLIGGLVWYYYIRPVPTPPPQPQGCTVTTPCPVGQHCVSGQCVAGDPKCGSNYQCPQPTQACLTGTCAVRRCTVNKQCTDRAVGGSSMTCVNQLCVQKKCTEDLNCVVGQERCINGGCYEYGMDCSTDTDCWGGLMVCTNRKCTKR
jgi:hypothetical protein